MHTSPFVQIGDPLFVETAADAYPFVLWRFDHRWRMRRGAVLAATAVAKVHRMVRVHAVTSADRAGHARTALDAVEAGPVPRLFVAVTVHV